MKNIHLSEILDNRDSISFSQDASVKDLLLCQMKNRRIKQFYIRDNENILLGTISKVRLVEYLAPVFCSLENEYCEELDIRLSEARVDFLIEKDFAYLTMKQYLPDAVVQFVSSGVNRLPVLDKRGRLIGEVSIENLLKNIPIKEKEQLYAY